MKQSISINRGDLLRVIKSGGDCSSHLTSFSSGFYDTGKPIVNINEKIAIDTQSEVKIVPDVIRKPSFNENEISPTRENYSFLVPIFAKTKPVRNTPPKSIFDEQVEPITDEELEVDWDTSGLPHTPLQAWSQLWPRIKKNCLKNYSGNKPDLTQVVRQLSRLKPIKQIPVLEKETWSGQWIILLDQRPELRIFWNDMDQLIPQLVSLRGKEGMQCVVLPHGKLDDPIDFFSEKSTQLSILPETPVLLLSDMGQLDQNSAIINYWVRVGERLQQLRCQTAALVPCPNSRWNTSLQRSWKMSVWDRPSIFSDNKHTYDPTLSTLNEHKINSLLNKLAPASYITPELLRLLRFKSVGLNAGHEFDVWHHSEMNHSFGVAGLNAGSCATRLEEFSKLEDDVRQETGESLMQCYSEDPSLQQTLVKLNLRSHGVSVGESENELLSLHRRSVQAMSTHRYADTLGLPGYYGSMLPRMSDQLFENDVLIKAWAASYFWTSRNFDIKDSREEIPDFMDMSCVREIWDFLLSSIESSDQKRWLVYFNGLGLELHPNRKKTSVPLPYLAEFQSCLNRIELDQLNKDKRQLRNAIFPATDCKSEIPVKNIEYLNIETDSSFLHLTTLSKPSWAERMGYDRFGLYADLLVKAVRLRLRWIPPGSFKMGSPEDEPGRFDNEVLHEVSLTRGYWIAETQTTQQLWQAVMGDNPSRFKGDDLPVESVSWEDCIRFCGEIETCLTDSETGDPPLSFSLPTEAQWEYACRAGTQTAFNNGEDPALDEVGWYDENSDQKTHPVKGKSPNAWGLYDMHGNVWEWCRDWYADYSKENLIDPEGDETGAVRVLRGGGWNNYARDCRSACRFQDAPGFRNYDFGFRLVTGQAIMSSHRRLENEGVETGKTAERNREQAGDKRGTSEKKVKFPQRLWAKKQRKNVPLEAKLVGLWDELTAVPNPWAESEQAVECPKWAELADRDELGKWASFSIKDVAFKFRKIEAGSFMMGSPKEERGRDTDEGPQHRVTLTKPFWMMDAPVTVEQWAVLYDELPGEMSMKSHPKTEINWNDCDAFCQRIKKINSHFSMMLPTEAQWEYACRAGTTTAFNNGKDCVQPMSKDPALDEVGWYDENSGNKPHPVREKKPNAWGLYDMHGNVWEWCLDGMRDYKDSDEINPVGSTDKGAERVLRGGGWNFYARYCRSAYRIRYAPGFRFIDFGFRLVTGHSPEAGSGAFNENV